MTITQMHVPVDDTHTYWYSFFTSFAGPVDKDTMRAQRLRRRCTLPDYVPKKGRHNDWGFNPEDQRTRTFLGMGEDDINLHDQWAVESMGAIQDRTREHLGTSDKVIMAQPADAAEGDRHGAAWRRAADGARRRAGGGAVRPGHDRLHRAGRALGALLARAGRGQAPRCAVALAGDAPARATPSIEARG